MEGKEAMKVLEIKVSVIKRGLSQQAPDVPENLQISGARSKLDSFLYISWQASLPPLYPRCLSHKGTQLGVSNASASLLLCRVE